MNFNRKYYFLKNSEDIFLSVDIYSIFCSSVLSLSSVAKKLNSEAIILSEYINCLFSSSVKSVPSVAKNI